MEELKYAKLEIEDSIAILWLDQPDEKVNKLSVEMLSEFEILFSDLETNNNVKAVILISKKKDTFIAGADLDVLKSVQDAKQAEEMSAQGNKLLSRMANSRKPFIAAIHGAAMGGGLEVALACHYRIATESPKTFLALPEVMLGLLPGGGGTQRLPRLIGIIKALDMMLTGRKIYAYKAKKIGLVDETIHPYGLLEAAKMIAKRLIKKPHKRKRKKTLMEKLMEGNPIGRSLVYKGAKANVQKQTYGNYPAPPKIIECVAKGFATKIERGLAIESKNFGELVVSPESKQLVNLFFSMNSRKKNPMEHTKEINKVGILGAGFMGAGVANVTANKGIPVVLKDINIEAANKGLQTVWQDIDKKVKKKAITSFDRDAITGLIFPTEDYQHLSITDMVIEAVFEDLKLKREVLAETEKIVKEDCIFASNTSSLPITDIAQNAKHPERVIGMHYFSPVPKMPLLEIITTKKAADWAIAAAIEIGIQQGKTTIVVNDGPGFYTTRILSPLMNEAISLLEEGAKIEDLDKAMKLFGFPVGPVALFDEVGIDVGAHVGEIMRPMFAKRGIEGSNVGQELYNAGYRGRKNGKGFYTYPQGKKKKGKKQVNTEIYKFFGGTSRKNFSYQEIQDRISLVMVSEALQCLQDGILKSPEDGDLGAILGLGFPPFRGGPFRYADTVGADKLLAKYEKLKEKHGIKFTPVGILEENAKENKTFYSD